MPRFDFTISLGTMIHLVVLVSAIFGAYFKVAQHFGAMQMKLDTIWDWWKRRPTDAAMQELIGIQVEHSVRAAMNSVLLQHDAKNRKF